MGNLTSYANITASNLLSCVLELGPSNGNFSIAGTRVCVYTPSVLSVGFVVQWNLCV